MLNIYKIQCIYMSFFGILHQIITTSNYSENTKLYTVISKSGVGGTITFETYK